MIFNINKRFEPLKNNLLNVILNFNSFDDAFGTGKRNSIKKIELTENTVIIKSFKVPNFINQFIYKYFRKSKAQRSFEYATKLLNLNIKTPTPIAYLELFSTLGLNKSYYISDFIDYDLTYRELINQIEYPDREAILKAFTKFTYDLHEKEIMFLDHSPGNTLIIKKNNKFDFYLVDLNRMQFRKLDFEARMKNFSRLTPKKEMVQIMSEAYADLSGESFEKIFKSMWFYTQQFQKKFQRKRRLKKQLFNK